LVGVGARISVVEHGASTVSSVSRRARIFVAVILLEAGALWIRSGRFGGNLVARCTQGHLFTTIWIPGASVKAIRLGGRRFQRCPVGQHWSIVKPVREAELTAEERSEAAEHRDVRLP
jgi:hypothetical protein